MNELAAPTMHAPADAAPDWRVLPAFMPVPGAGALAVNSFLLKGREPVLVDTGLAALGESFMETLAAEIDPADLRWIWLSHTDADHIGNLDRVLAAAPNARVVTNFLGMGKMGMLGCDLSRVHLLEPGARLELADRTLIPVRPPYYDAPETTGFFETRTRTFFAADSFGALLPGPVATIDDLDDAAVGGGLAAWSAIDAPWLATTERTAFERGLAALERLAPDATLSGHLPLARGRIDRLTAHVRAAARPDPDAAPDPLTVEAVADALSSITDNREPMAS